MGKNDNRTLPTSRANNCFTENVGITKKQLEDIEKAKRKEARRKKTRKEQLQEELDPFYLQALNTSHHEWVDTYCDLIVDWLIKKLDEKK